MAKNIMIQGTMSNVGKSLFTAGLLRILQQDGFAAAPFKSQNMALNSFVTEEGLEMGRAQVMQAEAAGIRPKVCMNPILLKPTTDMNSQVILNGEVLGNMTASDYFRKKKEFVPDVMKAYRELANEYEIIVIEGAGSPAEINLKENDIVNMGLAKLVNAPVILIGDIDRGGVFAQLYGTVALLEAEERKRIKGFIMNKFRGDKALLQPGIDMLYQKCNIPSLGVIPYLKLDLEDEDSLSERLLYGKRADLIDIAVIHFPHISNFTDFNPLENIEKVSLRYVSTKRELGNPDLILLPGTKNTMKDLSWMRANGIEQEIKKLVSKEESLLMGICGGFQMLGHELSDPCHMENGSKMKGMGLLPVKTEFGDTKIRSRVNGVIQPVKGVYHVLSGCTFSGYEIHMGYTTTLKELEPLAKLSYLDESGQFMNGYFQKNCMGTYVHGIFEEGTLRNSLLQLLFDKKGLVWNSSNRMDYSAYKNSQYDLLAELIRENTDIKKIYHMIGIA